MSMPYEIVAITKFNVNSEVVKNKLTVLIFGQKADCSKVIKNNAE